MHQTKWVILVSAVVCFLFSAPCVLAQEKNRPVEIDQLRKEIQTLNSQLSRQQKDIELMKQYLDNGDIEAIQAVNRADDQADNQTDSSIYEQLEEKMADQDAKIASLKENLAFVYKQTIRDTGIIEQYKLGNEIYFRSSYFDMNRENHLTGEDSYENAFVNLFDLKFSAHPVTEVQFNATISMYKLWGTWNSPESIRSSDFTYSTTPSDSAIKVKKAYVDYRPEWLGGRLNMTFGRLPTVDGYLTKYRYGRPSQSSYPDLAFNAESDGLAFSFYFQSPLLQSLNLVYARSEDDTDMNPFETDPLGLEDIDFYAAQLNTTIPFLDSAAFSLQWLRVDDVRISGDDVVRDLARDHLPAVADLLIFPDSLGKVDKYTVQLDKEKFFGTRCDFFFSASWSDVDPNKKQILVAGQPLDPAGLPAEIIPYTKYLYLGSADNQKSDTGWAIYTGARYHIDAENFKNPKIGLEYFKGSEYWVGLNVAGLDPFQKLNTRGEVWEIYWIQPLITPLLQCRLGYQIVERDYTATLFGGLYGAPEKADQDDALAYVSMEFMF